MVIFALCFLLFINAMSIGLVFPIFAPLFLEPGGSLFGAGASLAREALFYNLILAVPTLAMVFGAPFWGRVSDRIGRKTVLLLGLSGIALSFLLSTYGIWVSSLVLLFLSRAIAGFMDGSEAIAQAAIADISTPSEKARNMGYATFAGTIGFIIGPVMGGFLAEPSLTGKFHYEIPFIASFVLTAINGLILYWFFPKPLASPIAHESISYAKLLGHGFIIAFDKRIRNYSALLFILQWCLAAFYQISSLYLLERYHYSSSKLGLFTMFLGAAFSAGIFFVMYVLLQRVRHSVLLKVGLGFIALSLLMALCLQDSVLLPWLSVVPMMLGIAMMYNVLLAWVSNAVSEQEQGDAMGSGTSLKAMGWLSSGLMVAWLYPHLSALFLIMLAVVILGLMTARTIKG